MMEGSLDSASSKAPDSRGLTDEDQEGSTMNAKQSTMWRLERCFGMPASRLNCGRVKGDIVAVKAGAYLSQHTPTQVSVSLI